MDFYRTLDYGLVADILTMPEIYYEMGDDTSPPPQDFIVARHPQIHYLVTTNSGGRMVGMFALFPQNYVCWDLHVAMLPWASTSEKWCAARELVPWLANNTCCKRLTAAVPEPRRRALMYGLHGIGMRYVGRQAKAFLLNGHLRDLVLLGKSVGQP